MEVGDKLARIDYGNVISIVTITEETKTQWKLSDRARLKKETGSIVGSHKWSSISYRKAIQDDVLELTKKRLIRKLKNFDFSALELDTLVKVDELLHVKE